MNYVRNEKEFMRLAFPILILVYILVLSSCNINQDRNNDSFQYSHHESSIIDSLANISFLNKVADLGSIYGDTILTARYIFTNTGSEDLIIRYVNPDCSCTNYYISNDTIFPGDSAFIILNFTTTNRIGPQKIYATVCTNTIDKFYKLILKVDILRE